MPFKHRPFKAHLLLRLLQTLHPLIKLRKSQALQLQFLRQTFPMSIQCCSNSGRPMHFHCHNHINPPIESTPNAVQMTTMPCTCTVPSPNIPSSSLFGNADDRKKQIDYKTKQFRKTEMHGENGESKGLA